MALAARAARALAALAIAALLGACASTGPPPAPPAAPAAPAVAPPLAAELQWLQQLFAATPVVLEPTADGALRVVVPLKYAFDIGDDAIKPPLAGVLDKLAASLRRQRRTRLALAVPAPEYGASVRAALVARGIGRWRIDNLPLRADAVELRLVAPPPPIDRYEAPRSAATPR